VQESTRNTAAIPDQPGTAGNINFTILSDSDLLCFIKATEDILQQANDERKKRNLDLI